MADQFEIEESFRFVGRTFTEYRRMFGLDASDLVGKRVLDCPGGPGSFTAVASELADRALAVDPMYGRPVEELEPMAGEAADRTVEQLHEKRELFVWDEYGDPETRGRYLRAASERFLADYARHPGRYLRAGLPSLPLPDDSVGLALSANLLFLYDDRLDVSFHVASLLELARVARTVRVFPLHGLDGDRSALIEPVVDRLRAAGLSARFETVPYEFQPGATEALVLTGKPHR